MALASLAPAGTARIDTGLTDGEIGSSPGARSYLLYGLHVRSDFPLLAEPLSAEDNAPTCVIRRGRGEPMAVPAWAVRGKTPADRLPNAEFEEEEEENDRATWCRMSDGAAWWWYETVGTFYVAPDARSIDVYPSPGASARAIGLALTGPLVIYTLFRHGTPTLHASAVVAPGGGAVAFLGASGQGKSTMAASFLRLGASLLCDDVLTLSRGDGGIDVAPGPPLIKAWPETLERTLGLRPEGLPTVSAATDKKLLWLGGPARRPVRLLAAYVLDRKDPAAGRDIAIRPLGHREALGTYLSHLSRAALLQAGEAASFLPLFTRLVAQVPLRVLSYPGRYEEQDTVCVRVLRDLEGAPK